MTDREISKINNIIFYEIVDEANKDKSYYEMFDVLKEEIKNFVERRNVDCTDEEINTIISDTYILTSNEEPIIAEGDGYYPWLADKRDNITWTRRDVYNSYLIDKKKWKPGTVGEIDKMSDKVLDHIADPTLDAFEKKGLVIGDVQSGKTANYTGLINKSLDAGYKLIIILAGVHNDLRSQTQKRMDEQVIGYDSDKKVTNELLKVGVGKEIGFSANIETLTNKINDYKYPPIKLLSDDNNIPIIVIMKKNATILNAFLDNIEKNINLKECDKLKIPTLIIDDEVDQASVNTKKPEVDPNTINGLIRQIYNKFSRVSYVGYTATPYANILINDEVNTNEKFGHDLFPKDFVLVIPTPKDYCGVKEFFGDKDDDVNTDLIINIDDDKKLCESEYDKELNKVKFKSSSQITELNDSIKCAIDDYIVASAVRRSREGAVHNGMMIHLAAFKNPAESLKELIEEYITDVQYTFKYKSQSTEKYKKVWEERFKDVSINRGFVNDTWENIEKEIPRTIDLMKCKLLNGSSKDIIDYSNSTESQIIAVGGNKLSRGITIEGLMITYYLRTPNAYDTAMQMGRWFGYKKNYLDLCRIYTKQQMVSDFIHVYDAMEELKEDIRTMNTKDLNPTNFGLKIKTHNTMKPTSLSKMRGAVKMKVSFSEEREETIHFNLNEIDNNKTAANNFINNLAKDYNYDDEESKIIFRDVSVKYVLEFLKKYKFVENAGFDKTQAWIDYITKVNKDDELIEWTVMFNSLQTPNEQGSIKLGDFTLNKGRRSALNIDLSDVRAITGKSEFKYFFAKDSDERDAYKDGYKKGDEKLANIFNKKKAFMVIYPLNIDCVKFTTNKLEDVIGIGIWFPKTDNANYGEYYVNNVYINNMYSDDDDEEDDD